MLLMDIPHLSFSLLLFAVARLLVAKIHEFLIIDPTTLFLDIAHLLVFMMRGDVSPRRSFKFKFFDDTDRSRVGSSQKQMEDFCVRLQH